MASYRRSGHLLTLKFSATSMDIKSWERRLNLPHLPRLPFKLYYKSRKMIKNDNFIVLQPFAHCTIGVAHRKILRTAASTPKETEKLLSSASVDGGGSSPKGMFPSLMERAFLPQIVSQVTKQMPCLYQLSLTDFIFLLCRFPATFRFHYATLHRMIQMSNVTQWECRREFSVRRLAYVDN